MEICSIFKWSENCYNTTLRFKKPDVTKEIWFIIHGGAMLIVYASRNENEIVCK